MSEDGTEPEYGTPEGNRVIDLLWGDPTPGTRGPKPKISLRQIVDAGIDLAARDGLDALSMRKVGAQLGVSAMSLYTHVPGKSELIELMIDRVYAEIVAPDPDDPWRRQVEFFARQSHALYRRHPWLLETNRFRLPMGPHILDATEGLYRAITASGLPAAETVGVSNLISSYVYGLARNQIGDIEEQRRTGVSTEAYWESRSSFWGTYFDAGRFPTHYKLYTEGGFDAAWVHDLDFSLDRMLDGIEALVDRATGSPA